MRVDTLDDGGDAQSYREDVLDTEEKGEENVVLKCVFRDREEDGITRDTHRVSPRHVVILGNVTLR